MRQLGRYQVSMKLSLLLLTTIICCHISTVLTIPPCTNDETMISGKFVYDSTCDDNHFFNRDGGDSPYSLNYLPNNGNCFMSPYDENEKIFTCNNLADDTNRWLVWIGGSNLFFEYKTLIDQLMQFPLETPYDPQGNWDSSQFCPNWQELGMLDFIWDADRERVYSTAWGMGNCEATLQTSYWDGTSCPDYYGQTANAKNIFKNVPAPNSKGMYRLSYLNAHLVTGFPDAFDTVVAHDSLWLVPNPHIDIRFEWAGMWGDFWPGIGAHAANLNYLNGRVANENLDIVSFVQTDLGNDCSSDTAQNVLDGFAELGTVQTPYPVYYFSKKHIVYQQYQFSGRCDQNGHALQPMNKIFTNMYFNLICQPDNPLLYTKSGIPACFHMTNPSVCLTNSFTIHNPGNTDLVIDKRTLLVNLYSVCEVSYKFARFGTIESCDPMAANEAKPLPLCLAEYDSVVTEPLKSKKTYAFDAFVYIIFAIAFLYWICCVFAPAWLNEMYSLFSNAVVHARNSLERVFVNKKECDDVEIGRFNSIESLSSEIGRGISLESMNSTTVEIQFVQGQVSISASLEEEKFLTKIEKSSIATSQTTSLPAQHVDQKPNVDSERFEAIGCARFLASMHIVIGHMYQGGNIEFVTNFYKFGYTWVPWFFMLSGYILSIAETKRLQRKRGEESAVPLMDYIYRRLETIYPPYIFAMLASICTEWGIKGNQQLSPANNVMIYCLLMQSWIPAILEKGLTYLVQCWFLSCLLLYWALFHRIYDILNRDLHIRGLVMVAITCSVGLPVLYQLASIGQEEWYSEHEYESSRKGVDIAVLVLKFHPLTYIHIFILGCCLPRIRDIVREYTIVLPFLSIFSYLCLIIIFCVGDIAIPGFVLSFRLGIVSFFQSLLLLGLCNKEDFIAQFFSFPLLVKLGDFSFPQYCFQFLVLAWYQEATGEPYVDQRYFLLLFATSVAISIIAAPCGKRLGMFVACLTPFFIAYFMMQSFWAASTNSRNQEHSYPISPPLNSFFSNSKYYKDTPLFFKYETDGRWDYATFNPSILNVNGLTLFAARRGITTSQFGAWFNQTTLLNTWKTSLVVGTFDFKKETQLPLAAIDLMFKPCMPEPICNKNGTSVFKITTGPEDPRLFQYNGNYYLTMFGYDNIMSNRTMDTLSSKYFGEFGTGTEVCIPKSDGLIGRMHILKLPKNGPISSYDCVLQDSVIAPIMQNQTVYPNNSVTKNWLAFSFQTRLFFIDQISPSFSIMEVVDPDTEVVYAFQAYSSDTPSIIKSLDTNSSFGSLNNSQIFSSNIHGGANPVRYKDQYVSIFHVLSASASENYANYMFTFCPNPPFKIITRSQEPLYLDMSACEGRSNPIAFVSGLTLGPCTGENVGSKNCFLVTYGVCDTASRIIRINATAYMNNMMATGPFNAQQC